MKNICFFVSSFCYRIFFNFFFNYLNEWILLQFVVCPFENYLGIYEYCMYVHKWPLIAPEQRKQEIPRFKELVILNCQLN